MYTLVDVYEISSSPVIETYRGAPIASLDWEPEHETVKARQESRERGSERSLRARCWSSEE